MYRINKIHKGILDYRRATFGGRYKDGNDQGVKFELQDLDTFEYRWMSADEVYKLAKAGEIVLTIIYKGVVIVSIAVKKSALLASKLEYIGSMSKDIEGLGYMYSDDICDTIGSLVMGIYGLGTMTKTTLEDTYVEPNDFTLKGDCADYFDDFPEGCATSLLDMMGAKPDCFLFRDGMLYMKVMTTESKKCPIHCWKITDNKILLELL